MARRVAPAPRRGLQRGAPRARRTGGRARYRPTGRAARPRAAAAPHARGRRARARARSSRSDQIGARLLLFPPGGGLALFTGERTGGEEPGRVAGLRIERRRRRHAARPLRGPDDALPRHDAVPRPRARAARRRRHRPRGGRARLRSRCTRAPTSSRLRCRPRHGGARRRPPGSRRTGIRGIGQGSAPCGRACASALELARRQRGCSSPSASPDGDGERLPVPGRPARGGRAGRRPGWVTAATASTGWRSTSSWRAASAAGPPGGGASPSRRPGRAVPPQPAGLCLVPAGRRPGPARAGARSAGI